MTEETREPQYNEDELEILPEEASDAIDYICLRLWEMEMQIADLSNRIDSIVGPMKERLGRIELKKKSFWDRHSNLIRDAVLRVAPKTSKHVDTPWGRLGVRASTGSVDTGRSAHMLNFWEEEFPHVVEEVTVKKISLSNLTEEDRERLYEMSREGTLPSFVTVSPPDSARPYFKVGS